MEHQLRVTLDKSTQPWTVDIDQRGNINHIPRDAKRQTIEWILEGDAATGRLQPLAWVDPPPPQGIFGTPEVATNGRHMSMTDLNPDQASAGDWIYRLSLELDGETYSTLDTNPSGTNSNPSIKNN